MEKKIKVAMICHFSNSEVREQLPLHGNRIIYRFVRRLLGLPGKKGGYADIAVWDTAIIKAVKERDDIDLFVLSAHGGLKKKKCSFDLDKIHYSFFKCEFSNFLKKIILSDELWRKWNPLANRIQKAVYSIKPDLVLLVGAENAYYSSSVLRIKGYPIYLLCQNVYNNPEYITSASYSTITASTELKILKKIQYVAVYSKKHYDLLRNIGYDKYIFSFDWPAPQHSDGFVPTPVAEKKYDFINFAHHMSMDKGYHDCVKALSIVKKKYPNVQLNLIDGGPEEARKELKELINNLRLDENVSFTSFFADRNDLFQHLQNSRFAVLPCKIDHISGTQLQSMKFGLPVVCYRTTGTPGLNKKKKCVLIAEMNNVDELAEKMLQLMDDASLSESLRNNSLEYMKERREKSFNNMNRLVANFESILCNYKYGAPIPSNQLFDPSIEE